MTCEDLEMAFAVADMGLSCLVETENECEKTETEKKPCAAHAEAISDKGAQSCENEPFLSDNDCDDDGISFDLRLRSELSRNAIVMNTKHRCPGYLIRLIDRMPEKKSEMLADTLGFPFVALRQMLGHELFLTALDFFQSDRIAFPTREQVQRRQHIIDVFELSQHMSPMDIAHLMGVSFTHIQKCLMLVDAERKLYEELNAPEFRDDWSFNDDDAVV